MSKQHLSQTQVVAVTVIHHLQGNWQSMSVRYSFSQQFANNCCLFFIFSMVGSSIKKVKWPFCYLPLFPPLYHKYTQPHTCSHTRTRTHIHTHTHSPDFHHVGESQAIPGQTQLSWAKERNTYFASRVWLYKMAARRTTRLRARPNSFFLIRCLLFCRAHISLASSSVSVETSPLAILVFSSYPGGMKANV